LKYLAINILSCFVDESGDYGGYEVHSPYYIVTLVFHDQAINISEDICRLEANVKPYDDQRRAMHTGPLIRREKDYVNFDKETRKKIFNCLFNFAKHIDIKYKTFVLKKKQFDSIIDLIGKLSKQLSAFIGENLEYFMKYDLINVYYDNGQIELTKILVSIFSTMLNNVNFRKITPSDYKLAQVADLLCTVEMLSQKSDEHNMSKSETGFFNTPRNFRKTYLSALRKKLL
jgi:hypothetical protein